MAASKNAIDIGPMLKRKTNILAVKIRIAAMTNVILSMLFVLFKFLNPTLKTNKAKHRTSFLMYYFIVNLDQTTNNIPMYYLIASSLLLDGCNV
jgi:hypothetical protein